MYIDVQVVISETVERWKNRIVYRTPSGAKDEEQLLDFLNQGGILQNIIRKFRSYNINYHI